jgi:uncharacterized membrane protein
MTSPAYNPAMPPAYPPAGRLSKSSLFSLIFGILGCIPASGLLAMILGIIGFVKTGKPGVTGRWMAIVGGILGFISTLLWAIFGTTMVAGIFAVIGLTQAPVNATNDFLRNVSAGNYSQARVNAPDIKEEALKGLNEGFAEWGTFVETTFTTRRIVNNTAHLEGTAKFSKSSHRVVVDLENSGGTWEIQSIRFPDDAAN